MGIHHIANFNMHYYHVIIIHDKKLINLAKIVDENFYPEQCNDIVTA